jgi:nucleoside-diphosphate-sugar epimerase
MDLVTGAGGFIGGWLVKKLLEEGREVATVDVKPLDKWFQVHKEAQNWSNCQAVLDDVWRQYETVWHFGANMGGMGFIDGQPVKCAENVLADLSVLRQCSAYDVGKFVFASSACVYPACAQQRSGQTVKESDSLPAWPDTLYGWAKLYTERVVQQYARQGAFAVRIARLFNVYGPRCDYDSGKEKAPAATCRKVLEAIESDRLVGVWGDGSAVRTYLHISDALDGLMRLERSRVKTPINLGSVEEITSNGLGGLVSRIACEEIEITNIEGPVGVDHRVPDISEARELLNWSPVISLADGMEGLFHWIRNQRRVRA